MKYSSGVEIKPYAVPDPSAAAPGGPQDVSISNISHVEPIERKDSASKKDLMISYSHADKTEMLRIRGEEC